MKTLSIFAQRARMLRDERGLRQEDLAELLTLTRSRINSYENALREPDFDVLVQYAKFFDVSTDYMLGLTDQRLPYDISSNVLHTCNFLIDMMSNVSEEHQDEVLKSVMRYIRFIKQDIKDYS